MALAIRSSSSNQQVSCTMNVTNSERVLKSFCKARGYEKPVYRISSRNSAFIDGRVYRFKHYLATVSVNGHQLAEGDGFSKRIARKKAAMLGLQQLRVLELQNFWQDYRRVFPIPNRDTRSNFSSQAALNTLPNPLTITEIPEAMASTSSLYPHIEEALLPTESLTPTSPDASLVFNMTGMPVTVSEETCEIRSLLERTESVESSSNLLIAAAIEKLRAFRDDSDPAGWKAKEKASEKEENENGKPKRPEFSEDDLKLFNEIKPLTQDPIAKFDRPTSGMGKKNEIQQLISGIAEEIESFDESGIGDNEDGGGDTDL